MTRLADLLEIPDWQDQAQCKGTDPTIFFNETLLGRYGGRRAELESIAKSICNVCLVKPECLTYAIETDQVDGIWGGHTRKERKRIVRRQAAAS